jgi:hypothetical protein
VNIGRHLESCAACRSLLATAQTGGAAIGTAATSAPTREALEVVATLPASTGAEGSAPTLAAVSGTMATAVPAGTALPRRPLPPVSRDHYDIGPTIARGGMGRIVAATDRRLDRPLAIKELLVDTPISARGLNVKRASRRGCSIHRSSTSRLVYGQGESGQRPTEATSRSSSTSCSAIYSRTTPSGRTTSG